MNKISKQIIQAILIAIVVAGCIYSSRVEYTDDVLSGMSLEKYQYIHDRIAPASQYDVAQEYMKNKKFYDSKTY
ncbi:hypothetical protein [uncultured Bacteroides sp.]|jgi:hypothetical protein|uniref:hypothetical protein n=1 Tax=uncultured Bacteroides sp. TaxID=162156 RepID=UPI00258C8788|nr:hypothetical protein [uncultured Bacteroides sp.]